MTPPPQKKRPEKRGRERRKEEEIDVAAGRRAGKGIREREHASGNITQQTRQREKRRDARE